MKPTCQIVSACRHCQFYQTEGRRGGQCQQLGVPVQGYWKACSLACPPFAAAWKTLPAIIEWQTASLTSQIDPMESTLIDSIAASIETGISDRIQSSA